MQIKIRKGLDVPIKGAPDQTIIEEVSTSEVAILGGDIVGLRPGMNVAEGDKVKIGDVLFQDKKNPGVVITSPASGTIKAINRGHRRVLQSVVIQVKGKQEQKYKALGDKAKAEDIEKAMLETGIWPSLKTRPFSKVPELGSRPEAIFVNAMDSNPLAMDPMIAVNAHPEAFQKGVEALQKLTEGRVYISKSSESSLSLDKNNQVEVVDFAGPHPAGLAGTHIHFLHPVGIGRTVWSVGAQEVIALGMLVIDGTVWLERYVAVGGQVEKPRIVKVMRGAKISEILGADAQNGVAVSGSPLSGHQAMGSFDYLGRFDYQIALLGQPKERQLFGWIRQGKDKFSASNVFFSALNRTRPIDMTVNSNGSARAMMPTGIYEDLMPLDILPTQLLRAIVVGDTDSIQQLGGLELEEEDLALLSFASSSKYDYGVALRYCLEKIEKEG